MVISRAILVNCWPFLASVRAFLCLIDDHLECPDIFSPWGSLTQLQAHDSMRSAAQNPAVLGRDLLFCRAHRLIVDADPSLSGQPAGPALAARAPGLEQKAREGRLGRRKRLILGPGGGRIVALEAGGNRRGPRVGMYE